MLLTTLYKFANTLRKIYWFLFRPTTLGVKTIIECNGTVLLVRPRYLPYWSLPGGGVKRGESLIAAACREVREECGISLNGPKLLAVYSNFGERKSDHIILFAVNLDATPTLKKGLEIAECDFWPLNALPKPISESARHRLAEYSDGSIQSGIWHD